MRTEISDEAALDALVGRLLDPERDVAVIALTTRPGERETALRADEVREVARETPAEIVEIATGPLTYRLADSLSSELGVFGGAARIWWPGLRRDSHPLDHPLIFERHGVYGSQALQRLADALKQRDAASGRSATSGDPRLDLLDEQLARSENAADVLRKQLGEANAKVRSLQEGLAREQTRARGLARAGRVADDSGPESGDDAPSTDEERFLEGVFEAWLADTTSADRRAYPLGAFVLGRRLLETVAAIDIPIERVVRVCAWIASNRAAEHEGLRIHPFREQRGGSDPVRTRKSDGAKAWRAALKVSSPSAPRLHYWVRPDGVIEFASVNIHDDYSIPE